MVHAVVQDTVQQDHFDAVSGSQVEDRIDGQRSDILVRCLLRTSDQLSVMVETHLDRAVLMLDGTIGEERPDAIEVEGVHSVHRSGEDSTAHIHPLADIQESAVERDDFLLLRERSIPEHVEVHFCRRCDSRDSQLESWNENE